MPARIRAVDGHNCPTRRPRQRPAGPATDRPQTGRHGYGGPVRASQIQTALRRSLWWVADYAYAVRRIAASLVQPAPPWATSTSSGTEVPVLLIPGIYESWRFLEPLAERFLAAGHPVHVVPGLGLNYRSVRRAADAVVARLHALTAAEVVLVAHSKGGLIGKQVLLDQIAGATNELQPQPRVLGLVAVNTPFGGSVYASYVPVRAVRALSPRAVRALADQRAANAQITSLYAAWDPHIPGGSMLIGARNVQVRAAGHFRILGVPDTQEAIMAAVRDYR